ncbi:MAG: SAM-dependent methyltransferase [Gammaproteobacteria bacterium]
MANAALRRLVRRYQRSDHLAPAPLHTERAYQQMLLDVAWRAERGVLLHLDSCCGVGESTKHWAQQHPDAFVMGVDKSSHRLAKHPHYTEPGVTNYRLYRADCSALWPLFVHASWRFEHHNLWYPNPWPKYSQRQRRWYANPVMAALIRLQRRLVVRSNCEWYLEEFAWALRWWGCDPVMAAWRIRGVSATPFERKYHASEQKLWQLSCNFN